MKWSMSDLFVKTPENVLGVNVLHRESGKLCVQVHSLGES